MRLLRATIPIVAVFLLAFSVSLYSIKAARGSDHQDSPTVVANPLADITDVFAFPDPHDASRVALAMDVRPLIPPECTAVSHSIPTCCTSSSRCNGVASVTHPGEYRNPVSPPTRRDRRKRSRSTGPPGPTKSERKNTTVAATGTFPFGKCTSLATARSRSLSARGAIRFSSISRSSLRSFPIATT